MTDENDQHAPGGGPDGGLLDDPVDGPVASPVAAPVAGPVVHGTRSLVVAFVVNLVLAVAKFVGFVLTGSVSMLTEAVHSVAGAGGHGVLLRGGHHAKKEDDDRYRSGRGREGYFWGFMVSIVAFSLAGAFAVHEGLDALHRPQAVDDPEWALAILGVALVAQLLTFRTALVEARKVKGGRGYRRFVRRAETPELPLALVQGLGAVVGIVLAAGGVGLSAATDDGRWDGYATLAIGVLLAVLASMQVLVMKSLLIGQGASIREAEALWAAIEIDPDVVRIVHLHTRYLGPDELMVGARIELQHDLSLIEAVDTVQRLERHVRAAVPSIRHVYLEPDVHQDHRAVSGYVAEHSGHIDPDDPMYATITGRPIDPDDDIWTE